jgi:hypothetical protein
VNRLDYRRFKAVVIGLTELAPTIERHYEEGWVLLPDHSRPVGRKVRLIFGSDLLDDTSRAPQHLPNLWASVSVQTDGLDG